MKNKQTNKQDMFNSAAARAYFTSTFLPTHSHLSKVGNFSSLPHHQQKPTPVSRALKTHGSLIDVCRPYPSAHSLYQVNVFLSPVPDKNNFLFLFFYIGYSVEMHLAACIFKTSPHTRTTISANNSSNRVVPYPLLKNINISNQMLNVFQTFNVCHFRKACFLSKGTNNVLESCPDMGHGRRVDHWQLQVLRICSVYRWWCGVETLCRSAVKYPSECWRTSLSLCYYYYYYYRYMCP